jgi:signal transduction histidine kinase
MEARESAVGRMWSLLQQFHLISHIGTIFARPAKIDEVYRMILALLVSRRGAGFSRAFLLTYEPIQNAFICAHALGASSAEDAARLREQDVLHDASLQHPLQASPDEAGQEQRALDLIADVFAVAGSDEEWLRQLESEAQSASPLEEQCRGISISLENERHNAPLRRIVEENTIELVERDALFPTGAEEPRDLFDAAMLALPVRTNKGIRSLILVDRKFDRRSINETDKHYLEWFGSHISLIIENAELFSDLENAHNDLKDLDTLKSNFLSIISHELRTPLTAIMGFVDLLLEGRVGQIGEAQRNLLVRVSKNAEHLVTMVNDLLEIAEIEAEGLSEIRITPIDPLVALMNTLPRVEHRHADRNVIIEPIITEKTPKILSEERALERILYHLIDNAVKFSHKNSKVTIEIRRNADHLFISIRDRGIGISKDHLKRIFEGFHQIDNRLSRTYGGMGLGLTVTRMLLGATGGTIDVESTPGVGSTFTISYPISPAA